MRSTRPSFRGPLLLALTIATACGGSPPRVQPSSQFTSEDAELFNSGADYIEEPQTLDGAWAQSWYQDLATRVERADAVLTVRVRAVRTGVQPDGRKSYHLLVDVGEALDGRSPSKELTLTARPTDSGYASLLRGESRLIGARFVAFIKWRKRGSRVEAAWYLSPASASVLSQTKEALHPQRRSP